MTRSKKYLSLSVIFSTAIAITGCIVNPTAQINLRLVQTVITIKTQPPLMCRTSITALQAMLNSNYEHAVSTKHGQYRPLTDSVIAGGSIQEPINVFNLKPLTVK